MCLAAVSYTFVPVRAFWSPTNPDIASCAYFFPCSSPLSHIGIPRRSRLLRMAKVAYQFRVDTWNTSVRRGTSKIDRLDVMDYGPTGNLRQRRKSTQKLEHAGAVSGTSVLLSAIIVVIYVIPMTLVRMQAFIVTKLSLETRINALWLHHGRRSLAQR